MTRLRSCTRPTPNDAAVQPFDGRGCSIGTLLCSVFSLYMHTLPLEGYDAGTPVQVHRKTLPAYYGAREIYSVGDKAHDPRLSANGHPDTTAIEGNQSRIV